MDLSSLAPLLHNGHFIIDNSTFEYVLTCDRAALYAIVHQRKMDGNNAALNFGGGVHAAMTVRYNEGGFAHETLNKQYDAALQYNAEHLIPPDDWRAPADFMYDVLQKHALTRITDDFEVLEVNGLRAVEMPFAIPIGTIKLHSPLTIGNRLGGKRYAGPIEVVTVTEIPVLWSGKIDLVVRREGSIWIVDHKTTSVFGKTYFQQYYLSNQMMGYTWALRHLGYECQGVGINVFAIRKPTATGKGVEFGREWIPYDPLLIGEWQMNTLSILNTFFSQLLDDNLPMKMVWCVNKFGRRCQFWDVCTLPPAQRGQMLYSNLYKQQDWSPLED